MSQQLKKKQRQLLCLRTNQKETITIAKGPKCPPIVSIVVSLSYLSHSGFSNCETGQINHHFHNKKQMEAGRDKNR